MNRRGLTLLIVLLMAGSLMACGRKGALQPPPQSAISLPGAPLSS